MSLGAPGLLLGQNGLGPYEFCSVGLFVGKMQKQGVAIDVLGEPDGI